MLLASLPDFAALDWSALVWTDVIARLHPVLLHLPIGLLTLLFVAEVWGFVRRQKGERDGTRGLLVLLLFLTAPVVALSGWFLRTEGYVGIEWHRNLGIAVAALSVLIALTYWGKTRAYGALVTIGFATMIAASHLGASITHGEDFLFEPWHEAAKTPEPPIRLDRTDAGPAEVLGQGAGAADATDASPPNAADSDTNTLANAEASGAKGLDSELTSQAAGNDLASATAGTGSTDAAATSSEPTPGPASALPPTWTDVEPILANLCTKCHGTRKQKGELALHSESLALLGGENGPVVTPEDWRASPLLQAIALPLEHDDHMPPKEKRQPTPEEHATLQAWIAGLAGEVPTAEDGIEVAAIGTVEATPDEPNQAPSDLVVPSAPIVAEAAPTKVPLEAMLAAQAAAEQRIAAHVDEDFEAYASRLRSQQVGVAIVNPADASPKPAVRLNLTAYNLTADGLGEVLTGGPRQLREVVIFGQDLGWNDRFVLRQAAAEDGGLETLELRNLRGKPLDLRLLASAAVEPGDEPGSIQADPTNHLRHLNLAGTQLAPGAVAHLAAIPDLASVHLWGTGLTDADLAELAALRPGLRITGASAPLDEPVEVEPEVVFTKADAADAATAEATTDGPALVAENDTCPVSGSPVDPRYTVAFEGRLVGFCCTNCPKTFWDDPESFLAKLDAE